MFQPLRPAASNALAALRRGAHRAVASFDAWRHAAPPPAQAAADGSILAYRLLYWPAPPAAGNMTEVYRVLSVMSQRHVSRGWILRTSKLKPAQVDMLLMRLVELQAVEVIDVARFAPEAV